MTISEYCGILLYRKKGGEEIMWKELIGQKDKWIGGKIIDYGDSIDKALMGDKYKPMETKIVDFKLTDLWFGVVGEDFECGGALAYVGIVPIRVENGLALSGYGGHRWDIIKPDGSSDDQEKGET